MYHCEVHPSCFSTQHVSSAIKSACRWYGMHSTASVCTVPYTSTHYTSPSVQSVRCIYDVVAGGVCPILHWLLRHVGYPSNMSQLPLGGSCKAVLAFPSTSATRPIQSQCVCVKYQLTYATPWVAIFEYWSASYSTPTAVSVSFSALI